MRVLITGVTGFAGGHLAEALLERGGVEVYGLGRTGGWPPEWAHLAGRVPLAGADLTEPDAAADLLRRVRPAQIYHLAGYASVGQSFREPHAAWAGNLTATLHLLDSVARTGRARVLYVGSGLVYGEPQAPDQVFSEAAELRPASPYAASKAAADLAAYQCGRSNGLEVVRVRPFNHVGPRQSPQFAVASFAQQVAAVRLGLQGPRIQTGDLRPRRDLTDVRDMAEAYVKLMAHGRPGEAYNAGTGEAHAMEDVLARLQALAGVTLEVERQLERVRAVEVAVTRADARKLRRETGWEPRYTLDQTLADTLEYWTRQAAAASKE